MMRSVLIGLLLLVSAPSQATILPENDLHLQDNVDAAANMTEAQFIAVTDAIVAIWAPLAQRHGATLVANKLWTNPTVNANANQRGNVWTINMYGGLARRPEVTLEGYALVVCHELGHHFGGYPFYPPNLPWASSEGQADYFATQICGKMIWEKAIFGRFNLRTVNPYIRAKCDSNYTRNWERRVCYRNIAAGHSLATLLAAASREKTPPKFETPSQAKVTATYHYHPQAQCRLDTYIQGALCKAMFDIINIPSLGHPKGQASAEAEIHSNPYSCNFANGYTVGNRPACWYKGVVE
ncbi:MAG: hypothetical protein AB7F59_08925 [Bdellovibrionales bacterium]